MLPRAWRIACAWGMLASLEDEYGQTGRRTWLSQAKADKGCDSGASDGDFGDDAAEGCDSWLFEYVAVVLYPSRVASRATAIGDGSEERTTCPTAPRHSSSDDPSYRAALPSSSSPGTRSRSTSPSTRSRPSATATSSRRTRPSSSSRRP